MRRGDEKALCSKCLEWFADRDLKTNNGHPYCVHCFPIIRVARGAGIEAPPPFRPPCTAALGDPRDHKRNGLLLGVSVNPA